MMTDDELFNEHVAQICEYVVECRGRGFFLPPSEITLIQNWLRSAPSFDSLILILSDLLPVYFADSKDQRVPRSLSGINRKVLAKLNHLASRTR